jgi:putative ABC transport system permease protein
MLKNYFKTAIRNLIRYKGFSTINIASLAIGITGCLIIGLFVWDELQYDKFVKGGENIYRTYNTRSGTNGDEDLACVPPMFATYLKEQYPEVDNTARLLMWNGKMLMESGDKLAYEEKGLIADSTFFRIFPLKFLKGEPITSLDQKSSVVLTEELATKYFGRTDPIGKLIKLDKEDFIVKGVLARVPTHFHLDFNYIIPMSAAGLPAERMQKWTWQQFFTYIKVKPGTNIENLQSKFQAAIKKEIQPLTNESGIIYEPKLQALTDIHLKSADFVYDNAKRGNQTYVNGLMLIAIFVLVIACFNFVNLSTARSLRRAKEIGVRKVIGADRKQLIIQYTGEAILLSLISIIIAAIATALIVPALNNFTDKSISFNPITNPVLILILLAGGIVLGTSAGIYPALVLSHFQPIKVLKGLKASGGSNTVGWLRQSLVVAQFALFALLIVSTIIVYRQINYLHKKDLGFNKEQVLYFEQKGSIEANREAFREELKRSPNIVSVTTGYGLPGDQVAGDGVTIPGANEQKDKGATLLIVDHDYIKTLGLQVISGRDFSRDIASDTAEAFIINETAVKEYGFETPEKAIGKKMHWNKWVPDSINPVKKGSVIGVVKDFHYKSLHEKVAPLVMQIYSPVFAKVAVKVRTADLGNTIEHIKAAWQKFSPQFPLDYKFMDESFDSMYKSEDKLRALLAIFTGMAIFVGCMGLFGLAAFSAEQRTKEISIRKVLGASVISIVTLLSSKFIKPVFIASLIAFPIAWSVMNKWLENFPYRVEISWWIFAISALAALLIALITVSFQSIKAAVTSPVKTLRSE